MNPLPTCSELADLIVTQHERLVTLHQAASALGIQYWQLQRAVKRGDLPSYTPFNKRRLVKLSELTAYIDSTRQGGLRDVAV
jgi:hypothetical protein